jgi:hypothetical protein
VDAVDFPIAGSDAGEQADKLTHNGGVPYSKFSRELIADRLNFVRISVPCRRFFARNGSHLQFSELDYGVVKPLSCEFRILGTATNIRVDDRRIHQSLSTLTADRFSVENRIDDAWSSGADSSPEILASRSTVSGFTVVLFLAMLNLRRVAVPLFRAKRLKRHTGHRRSLF